MYIDQRGVSGHRIFSRHLFSNTANDGVRTKEESEVKLKRKMEILKNKAAEQEGKLVILETKAAEQGWMNYLF